MSLELSLLVFDAAESSLSSLAIANTMIEVIPDERLAKRLFALESDHGRAVPARFQTYTARDGDEPHYGNTQATPYGEPLRWLTATELVDGIASIREGLALNRAAWAYLRALPVGYGVALYWH
jgi:hypothetical protein